MFSKGACGSRLSELRVDSERDRFIDQHDRNIFLDGIHEPAVLADQAVAAFIQVNIAFAFRASENVQEVFADRHEFCLLSFDLAAFSYSANGIKASRPRRYCRW